MSRFGEIAQKGLGIALMLAALAFAAAKAPDRPLESLVGRWAPPPSDFIELPGQLVHLRDQGPPDDPLPLVLLHGTSASLHTWEAWATELSRTRRVISLDLPGFGLSSGSPQNDYSDAAYVEFLARLLARLKLQRVVLAGNSLGGEIAWHFALARPAQVAGLVLVDAAGLDFQPEQLPLGFRIARLPLLRQLTRWVLPRRVVEDSVMAVYGDPARVSSALVDRYYELTLREGNREALLHRIDQLRPGEGSERLGELRVPTLILWGERDRLIPPRWGQALHAAIPGSELVMLPGLGHVPQEEDPAATLAPLRPWLARIPERAPRPQDSEIKTPR